ncbi:hypothetical protein FRB95_013185 [Tulasnella sp. JGI-2019a]|nr:hypothetical protein FRB95_013185 [Tulasnella sp. JGI-2019a]
MPPPQTSRPRKTMILCFDGTGNSFDDENTNIVRLFSALDKTRTDKQICYYQPGIGTYVTTTSSWSPLRQKFTMLMDEGFAWYLDAHIMGGYRFLMENWEEGDKICLFGFSRGAYTARCLAGMLQKVGLLPRHNEEQVAFAYKKYTDVTKGQEIRASGFKAAFSRDIVIDFVGVWDTVASVGIFSKHLPFTASNHIIKSFRHALSLDEHRAKFKPNPWHRAAPTVSATDYDPECGSAVLEPPDRPNMLHRLEDAVVDGIHQISDRHIHTEPHHKTEITSASADPYEMAVDPEADMGAQATSVREIWFAGCHADVGGGSVSNNTANSLANPSLKWMVNEILDSSKDLGIYFKPNAFEEIQAFDTIITTTLNPSPRPRRKGIPSAFLNASNKHQAYANTRKEASEAPTMVDGTLPYMPGGTTKRGPSTGTAVYGYDELSPTTSPTLAKPGAKLTLDPQAADDEITIVEVVENAPDTDADAPMYDRLKGLTWWWILEYLWLPQTWQDRHGVWQKRWTQNRGKPRAIHDMNPLFHRSVQRREATGYRPRATLPTGAKVEYVEQ